MRIAYPNYIKMGFLDKFDFESYDECDACLLGKMAKAPFTKQSERGQRTIRINT